MGASGTGSGAAGDDARATSTRAEVADGGVGPSGTGAGATGADAGAASDAEVGLSGAVAQGTCYIISSWT